MFDNTLIILLLFDKLTELSIFMFSSCHYIDTLRRVLCKTVLLWGTSYTMGHAVVHLVEALH